jgi:small multidrug resistance family-3 protein
VSIARSILLFATAALFEIGGAWLVWQGVREYRGWTWAGLGAIALGAYAAVCLAGIGVIMYAPRWR